jgi:hypothetical protein
MGILDFVTDDKLRKTLEISLKYIFRLHEKSEDPKESSFYQLYIISFIEAILLFLLRARIFFSVRPL